ncbi:zinc finger protein castor homolog 1-like isoform X2 [Limulus polyphemus]|uniref:Zinc finger protein castor homolog 1-like isoform X2 n=1 Tax=Limulus polyphemus TaxID=6850 RepID=A0ABM1RZU9_LIMPO|nr:zinc finger protein castor homolog 1-like isoform X2 [Limulus polyphemus]
MSSIKVAANPQTTSHTFELLKVYTTHQKAAENGNETQERATNNENNEEKMVIGENHMTTESSEVGSPLCPFNRYIVSKSINSEMQQDQNEEEGNRGFNLCDDEDSEVTCTVESRDIDNQDVETPGESEAEEFVSNSRSEFPMNSSHRNKRKNFQPRNIVYQYSDSEAENDLFVDYNASKKTKLSISREVIDSTDSQDCSGAESERSDSSPCRIQTSMVSIQGLRTAHPKKSPLGDKEQPLDLSSEGMVPIHHNERPASKGDISPVDLTTRKDTTSKNFPQNVGAVNLSKNNELDSAYPLIQTSLQSHAFLSRFTSLGNHLPSTRYLDFIQPSDPSGKETVPPALDAFLMRDYAESTMKELLGIYGLNDMVDSITKNVPLQNFSSGKILENMPFPALQFPYFPIMQQAPSSIVVSQHLPLATEAPSYEVHSSSVIPTLEVPSSVSKFTCPTVTSHSKDVVLESIRSNAADSLSNISPVSSNNVMNIHNPRDMATILTLAALGSKVATAKASPEGVPTVFPAEVSSPVLPIISSVTTTPALMASPNEESMQETKNRFHPLKLNHEKSRPMDYTRFTNAAECGSNYCKDLNYREHFHCLDCNSRVFVKKEEMIRHFKWHKKRDESLQHGFMRYSPMDDCSDRFTNCSHNRKQTHYHCLKEGCDKVYISTSDVQMHANYHRKDSAIIREGFQRFRATEDCGTPSCSFYDQRTTHFHCRRLGCSYNFKNKADMEKHKTFHIKDEQLNKDGFKKFMKQDHCSFENCRFSRVCNHIHCIRPGCTYVLHSSGQLYSHKRKHERRENEMAYRKYRLAQSMMKTMSEPGAVPSSIASEQLMNLPEESSGSRNSSVISTPKNQSSTPAPIQPNLTSDLLNDMENVDTSVDEISTSHQDNTSASRSCLDDSLPLSFANFTSLPTSVCLNLNAESSYSKPDVRCNLASLEAVDLTKVVSKPKNPDDAWKKYVTSYTANTLCRSECELAFKDHFHCSTDNCDMIFRAEEISVAKEHVKNHETQNKITEAYYITVEARSPVSCPLECSLNGTEKHYHCNWRECQVVISSMDKPFERLNHYKVHKYTEKQSRDHAPMALTTSVDGIFKRKRGRPPKNRVIEFSVPSTPHNFPQAIYTSFKLPKPTSVPHQTFMATPFRHFGVSAPPPPLLMKESNACSLLSSTMSPNIQYHSSSDISSPTSPTEGVGFVLGASPVSGSSMEHDSETLSSIQKLSQMTVASSAPIEKEDGFYVFPKNTPCPDNLCLFLENHHFHCTQPRCHFVTDRSDILLLHSKDFHDNIDIMEGFLFFDRSVDCRFLNCQSNKVNRHFHCVRPGCNYSFVRYSTMSIHDLKHQNQDGGGSGNSQSKQKTSVSDEEESQSPKTLPVVTTVISEATRSPPATESSYTKATIIKAKGTYYPLSAFINKSDSNQKSTAGMPVVPEDDFRPDRECQKSVMTITSTDSDPPLTKLLQQPIPSIKNAFQEINKHIQYGTSQNCGRPFCKLKKKEHFHCNICNQAFSSFSRLRPHVTKHAGGVSPVPVYVSDQLSPNTSSHSSVASGQKCDEENASESDDPDTGKDQHPRSSINEDNSNKTNDNPRQTPLASEATSSVSVPQLFAWQPFPLTTISGHHLITPQGMVPPIFTMHGKTIFNHHMALATQANIVASSEGFYGSPQVDYSANRKKESLEVSNIAGCNLNSSTQSSSSNCKKMRMQSSRILKDEPVPEGYIRYRFNEDCAYTHCGYREHQTHFHCIRTDCGYSFCDKTRFVQHTARHERLDTLMGGDFEQYRANINCGRPDCMYMNTVGAMANKASHFHCRKCDFVCTDTNKVVAHRRQHLKIDCINAAGFDKYTTSQDCNMEGCNHNRKQTHYHCLKCQYAVLGLSQMSAHKYRHMD